MDDELQEIRDNFFVGNFAKALEMCETAHPSNDFAQAECDALLARCCLSLGQYDRLKAMQNSTCPGQKATALTAVLIKSKNEQQISAARDRLKDIANQTQDMSCNALAASALANEGAWSDAVQLTTTHPTLEMQALRVFILLLCNQASAAEKQVKDMSGSDDSSAFKLAQAAVYLATGNSEEAYHTYCDLSTQYPVTDGDDSGNGSVLLQAGKAVANMQRGMYSEAFEDLNIGLAVAPADADTLVSLCCCDVHLGKKQEFEEHYTKLSQAAPSHPYVAKTQGMKNVFARFQASLTA